MMIDLKGVGYSSTNLDRDSSRRQISGYELNRMQKALLHCGGRTPFIPRASRSRNSRRPGICTESMQASRTIMCEHPRVERNVLLTTCTESIMSRRFEKIDPMWGGESFRDRDARYPLSSTSSFMVKSQHESTQRTEGAKVSMGHLSPRVS